MIISWPTKENGIHDATLTRSPKLFSLFIFPPPPLISHFSLIPLIANYTLFFLRFPSSKNSAETQQESKKKKKVDQLIYSINGFTQPIQRSPSISQKQVIHLDFICSASYSPCSFVLLPFSPPYFSN